MRIAAAGLLLVAACSGQRGASAPLTSPPSQRVVSPETPLAEIPPQELAAGQCGLAIWQRSEPARRIVFVTNQPGSARIVDGGKVVALRRTGMSGDTVFGHAPQQRFEGGVHVIELDVRIEPRDGLVGGAIVPEGSLTYRSAAIGSVVLPVFGLIGCK